MPKLKTHRSAAKRYKVTASGKIMKRQAGIVLAPTQISIKKTQNFQDG